MPMRDPQPGHALHAGMTFAAGAQRPDARRERLLDAVEWFLRRVRPHFAAGGRRYAYAIHAYNRTMRNERCVELPLVMAHVHEFAGKRILEVGNVLAHYGAGGHTVIDKYERAPGVHNVDVVDYRPPTRFDLIVSISTLEHVGWDEEPRDPERVLAAFANLTGQCLAPGGRMVVTLPLGYNPVLDAALWSERIAFDRVLYMQRHGRFLRWRECSAAAARRGRYGHPYPFANAVCVGIRDASPAPQKL
jgi:hypothetical protein